MLRYSAPATSPGGEEQGDTACNRRPAGYDPKELLSDMIERGELDMQWCDRHCHDKHPKEYSGKDEGYSHSSLADNWLIEWGHRGPLADARVTVVETLPSAECSFPWVRQRRDKRRRPRTRAFFPHGSCRLGASPWVSVYRGDDPRIGIMATSPTSSALTKAKRAAAPRIAGAISWP